MKRQLPSSSTKIDKIMNKTLTTTLLSAMVAFSAQAQDVTGTIHTQQGKQKIYKEIYGQFAEHLGSCIYGGLWVGPDSKIPNTQGYRNDVLQALKDLKVPVLRWPEDASLTNITGWTASVLARSVRRCKTTTGVAPSKTTPSVHTSS